MSGQNISAGMKVWGVVTEVNEKDLVISLPGGLRGLVRASEAMDPILDNETKVIINISFHVTHCYCHYIPFFTEVCLIYFHEAIFTF